METGRAVILLNLENLYESLYDLLNQVKFVNCYSKLQKKIVCYDCGIILLSTILWVVALAMLTLDYKHTVWNAEFIQISSKIIITYYN